MFSSQCIMHCNALAPVHDPILTAPWPCSRFLDKAAIINHEPGEPAFPRGRRKPATVTQVEEVKMVMRILPVALLTVVFYTAYAQLVTFSVEQGQTMDRSMGRSGFKIPPASLGVFRELSIMLLLPMYGPYFVPLMRRVTGQKRGVTTLQRIGIGLVLSTISMLCAALVEARRLHVAHQHGLRDSPDATVPMSVFWLVPQFAVLGTGEVFTLVGQLEFCYNESPIGMRSMGTAVFLCTVSLGYFTSSFLVSSVNSLTQRSGGYGWLVTNLNQGRLDYFYYLLVIITVLNFFGFLTCAHWYTYKASLFEVSETKIEKLSRLSPYDEPCSSAKSPNPSC